MLEIGDIQAININSTQVTQLQCSNIHKERESNHMRISHVRKVKKDKTEKGKGKKNNTRADTIPNPTLFQSTPYQESSRHEEIHIDQASTQTSSLLLRLLCLQLLQFISSRSCGFNTIDLHMVTVVLFAELGGLLDERLCETMLVTGP